MNIKQAKEQIQKTMKAYFTKDSFSNYLIPIERQRSIFLMGPPGCAKKDLCMGSCPLMPEIVFCGSEKRYVVET